MNRKKKKQNFGKNKKAFDKVVAAWRGSIGAGLGSVRMGGAKGAQFKVRTKPTPIDFRADVQKVVQRVVKGDDLIWFWDAYSFDSVDPLDIEFFTYKMLGARKHSWEQRLGKLFIDNKLIPPEYFGDQYEVKKDQARGL
jgi:hypothetical protein